MSRRRGKFLPQPGLKHSWLYIVNTAQAATNPVVLRRNRGSQSADRTAVGKQSGPLGADPSEMRCGCSGMQEGQRIRLSVENVPLDEQFGQFVHVPVHIVEQDLVGLRIPAVADKFAIDILGRIVPDE